MKANMHRNTAFLAWLMFILLVCWDSSFARQTGETESSAKQRSLNTAQLFDDKYDRADGSKSNLANQNGTPASPVVADVFNKLAAIGTVTAIGSETKVNTTTANSQQNPSSAMQSNGDYVVVWESFGNDGDGFGIYGQRYNSDGTTNGTEFLVNTTTAGNQRYPDVAMDEDGDFVVTWMHQSGGNWEIRAQRYDNAGATAGSEIDVESDTRHNKFPKVAMDKDGNFITVWVRGATDGSDFAIRFERRDSNGVKLASNTDVTTLGPTYVGHPDIGREDEGDFVVVWQNEGTDGSGHGVFAQRYDNAGAAQGTAFQVNTTTSGNQQAPAAAMDSSGSFVVAWTSFGQDGGQGGIYAQRFDNTGNTVGSEFGVNTTTTGSQDHARIAATLEGHFTIAWSSYAQDGSFDGVYLQAYGSDGDAVDSEKKVNTRTTDFQQFGAIAQYQAANNAVVAWQDGLRSSTSTNDGSDYGIYSQRYAITISVDLIADAGADTAICDGQSVQIGGSPTASGGNAPYTYNWSPATGLDDATLANPTATPTTTTEYIVTVTDNSSNTAMDTVVVTVNPSPIADAGSDQEICLGDTVQIGGSPTGSGGTGALIYAWAPATGIDDASAANPKASPPTTTQYIVTITDANNCTDTDTVTVTVNPKPVADAGADYEICAGDTVQIGGSPTGSGGTGALIYAWAPATGLDDASAANPKAFPVTTTQYIVTITDANNCTDTDTMTVTVNPNPVADAGADQVICVGDTVQIGGSPTGSGGTGALTYAWTPALGLDDASAANPKAFPATTTQYIVTVTDANSCTATDTVLVTVDPNPVVDAGPDVEICVGDSVQIGGSPTATGGTAPYTYAWAPATGLSSASAANPKASPAATTQYIITVTDANNCSASDTVLVTVNPNPVADAGADQVICVGDTVQIGGSPTGSGGTGALTYAWTPALGLDDASAANPKAFPATTTQYIVTVTDANSCTATDTVLVTVDPNPVVDAGPDVEICVGDSVQIGGSPTATGGTAPYTYAWTPATGLSSASAANPKASPAVTTQYIITVTDANNCSASDTVLVTVNPNPIADAGADQEICEGDSVQIGGSPTATGGTAPYAYSWSPVAGLSSATAANPKASPATTTQYIVTVTDAKNCVATDTVAVAVNPKPVADAGSDVSTPLGVPVLIGGSPTATDGTPPYTYAWSPATGLDDATIANPTASPASTTQYIVTVTDAKNCTDTDTIVVTITPGLMVDAGADTALCDGESAPIGGSPTASGGTAPYSYSWTPAIGLDDATIANPTASPATTTEYVVTVTDANSTVETDTVIVTINPNPIADAGPDQVIVFGDDVQIGGSPTASGGTPPYTYAWSPATGLDDATVANPTASPSTTTEYIVNITDVHGCTDSDTMIVTVTQPKDFVLLANGTLIIDQPRNAFGDVHANEWIVFEDAPGNKLTGNVTAVEEITINDGNTIVGDVTAGDDIMNDGTVTGTVTDNANVATELLPVLDPIIPGTNDVNVPNSAVQSLAPGDYKNIMIGRKATLKFSPGTYNLNQLYASDEAKLVFDVANGKITLNIADDMFLDDYVRFGGVTVANIEDTDSLTINIAGDDLIEIGMNSLVYGTIIAPDADIDFGDNTLFKGAVCAEDIKSKMNVRFLHHSFGTSSSTGLVMGKGSGAFDVADVELDRELADLFSEVPEAYRLEQNYPNPFNPSTTIQFALPEVSQVTLSIYNMTGQLVRTLVSAELAPGQHSFTWDATDDSGVRVASGMYLYQLRADDFRTHRKLLLMK